MKLRILEHLIAETKICQMLDQIENNKMRLNSETCSEFVVVHSARCNRDSTTLILLIHPDPAFDKVLFLLLM